MTHEYITPTDGMIISKNTRLAPGEYVLPHGLTIAADNITLDGTGVHIIGQNQQGAGVASKGRNNVTVRGLSVSNYYHGLRFDHCQNVIVEGVRARDTAEVAGIDTFLYLWTPVEEAYGGALLLHDVQGGAARDCDFQHQQNGALLYDTSGFTVERVNASFNSGWGVYLSRANDNLIQDNQLDFCNRVYRRPEDGSIRVEADASGIVLVYGSSRNRLWRNSCLCGGDGIFIAGYDHKGDKSPCNDNLIEENDCRLSPNNAIESTFSRGNIFRRNDCSRSNYGFWLGYSWDNVVEDNNVEFNRWAGIAIEHGYDITIHKNNILRNGEGIRLWANGGPLLEFWPENARSHNMIVAANTIADNDTGFNAYIGDAMGGQPCYDFAVKNNLFRNNREAVRLAGVEDCMIHDNTFAQNVVSAIRLVGQPGVTVGENVFAQNAADIVEGE